MRSAKHIKVFEKENLHITAPNHLAYFSGGEMQNITECKIFFILITLGLSEAIGKGLHGGFDLSRVYLD
jgi:hypothetical protein